MLAKEAKKIIYKHFAGNITVASKFMLNEITSEAKNIGFKPPFKVERIAVRIPYEDEYEEGPKIEIEKDIDIHVPNDESYGDDRWLKDNGFNRVLDIMPGGEGNYSNYIKLEKIGFFPTDLFIKDGVFYYVSGSHEEIDYDYDKDGKRYFDGYYTVIDGLTKVKGLEISDIIKEEEKEEVKKPNKGLDDFIIGPQADEFVPENYGG